MNDYLVRFAATLSAASPGEAVNAMCGEFSDRGTRDWIYRVDDPETIQVLGYFDGWGNPVDMNTLTDANPAVPPEDAPTAESVPEQIQED